MQCIHCKISFFRKNSLIQNKEKMRRVKRMKKIAVIGVVGLIGIGMLTACGKDKMKYAHITIVSELPDADISLPEYLISEDAETYGLKEVARTGNGYAVEAGAAAEEASDATLYHVDGETRSRIVNETAAKIEGQIENVLDDKEMYPLVTGIEAKEDGTEFRIYMKEGEMNLYEMALQMSFFILGDKYQVYAGKPAEEAVTTVIYVDKKSGTEIYRTDSASIK